MENQLHLRIKNPETKAKIDNICKSKNISFNQLVNEILDDYLAQTDDKKYLKTTSESLFELEKRQNELIKLVQKSLLMERKILELMTKNLKGNNFEKTNLNKNFSALDTQIDVKFGPKNSLDGFKNAPDKHLNKDDFEEKNCLFESDSREKSVAKNSNLKVDSRQFKGLKDLKNGPENVLKRPVLNESSGELKDKNSNGKFIFIGDLRTKKNDEKEKNPFENCSITSSSGSIFSELKSENEAQNTYKLYKRTLEKLKREGEVLSLFNEEITCSLILLSEISGSAGGKNE